jgi:hypothetical protein
MISSFETTSPALLINTPRISSPRELIATAVSAPCHRAGTGLAAAVEAETFEQEKLGRCGRLHDALSSGRREHAMNEASVSVSVPNTWILPHFGNFGSFYR